MATVFKQTSGSSTNLQRIGNVEGIKCYGYNIDNTSAAARFVKLYWGVPGQWSSNGSQPTVGTDIPLITIQIAAGATAATFWQGGVGNLGEMWSATTVNAADSDATAVTAGDLITSVFYG